MYQLGQEISETTKLTLIDDYFSKIYYGDKITYVSISDYDNKQPFIDFVNGNGIQFIHTNNEQGLLQLNNNEGFKEFKDNFSNYGFKKINIKGDDDLLFIKNNLYATYLSEKHNF